MKYRLLAFDLDGTLTNSEKKITERTRAALYEARNKGAAIALASGRPVYGIMPLAKELELDTYGGYILAYNGGCIIDCSNMDIVYDKKLPANLVGKICRFAKEAGLTIMTYEGDMIVASGDNEYLREEARINNLPVKIVDDMEKYVTFDVNKFLITEHPDVINSHIEDVRAHFPELNVFTSAPFFMEIVPQGIDKAEALSSLLGKLKLEKEELAAFGDGNNDISMIKYAGCGVAMANASKDCLLAADVVTVSNDEDGVAVILEKMMTDTI